MRGSSADYLLAGCRNRSLSQFQLLFQRGSFEGDKTETQVAQLRQNMIKAGIRRLRFRAPVFRCMTIRLTTLYPEVGG